MTRSLALIFEDDPSLGAIFEKTLQSAGFETTLDPLGNLYNDILTTQRPALVILDLHLPYTTGREILNDLRQRYSRNLPVIIVTADIYQARDMEAKGETVLVKPVSIMRLLDVALSSVDLPKSSDGEI